MFTELLNSAALKRDLSTSWPLIVNKSLRRKIKCHRLFSKSSSKKGVIKDFISIYCTTPGSREGLTFRRTSWLLTFTNSFSPELSSRRESKPTPGWGHCAAGGCTCGVQRPPPSEWLSSARGLWCPCRRWGLIGEHHLENVSAPPEGESRDDWGFVFTVWTFFAFSMLDLYGLEHQLSVVEGPQIFGNVQTNWADGCEEVKHHWNHLEMDRKKQLQALCCSCI